MPRIFLILRTMALTAASALANCSESMPVARIALAALAVSATYSSRSRSSSAACLGDNADFAMTFGIPVDCILTRAADCLHACVVQLQNHLIFFGFGR